MNALALQVFADQSKRIRSLSLDRSELRHLLELLQERSLAAGDIEVSHFQKRDQTDDIFEANKKVLKDGFSVWLPLAFWLCFRLSPYISRRLPRRF
jgi:hypothetical protein